MNPNPRHRLSTVALAPIALCMCLFLAACGDSVKGTYSAEGGMPMSMTFKSGGKVTVSMGGQSQEATYKVSGETVTVDSKDLGGPVTFTKQKDGSLVSQGGMMSVTLKKK
jgi:hypothetical protein